MLLSDKYWDYIDEPARAEFLEGTTAAGKTTTVGIKFIMNVEESDMTLHVIASKTTGIAEKNIIHSDYGLMQIFPDDLTYYGNGDKDNKIAHIKLKTNNKTKIIYVLGYDNKDKWETVLGSQFGCVWLDECNTANINFVREVFGRSKYFVGTLNPDDPNLQIYDEYVNRSRPIEQYKKDIPDEIMESLLKCEPVPNWKYWFFSFEDNISMSAEQIEEKKLSYPKGTKIYKNKVQGLRGKATGLVFSNFNYKRHVRSKEWAKQFIQRDRYQEEYFAIFTSGLDTAYSQKSPDTISMSFRGITNKGKTILLDEKVYNNKDLENPIAPSDTVVNYIAFLERNRKEWGFAKNVFVDSADQATQTEIMKYKRAHNDCLYIFNDAYKKIQIIDRIILQLGWMAYDDDRGKEPCFFVLDHCKNYTNELDTYSWLEDKDNTPEDGHDHMINSDQYSWIPYIDKIGVDRR